MFSIKTEVRGLKHATEESRKKIYRKGQNSMSQSKHFEQVDIISMTDEELIEAIERMEKQIAEYEAEIAQYHNQILQFSMSDQQLEEAINSLTEKGAINRTIKARLNRQTKGIEIIQNISLTKLALERPDLIGYVSLEDYEKALEEGIELAVCQKCLPSSNGQRVL